MRKIYKGWKVLKVQTGLWYDSEADRVVCSDEAWQSFIKEHPLCRHLRYEGLRHKELQYNVFEKTHAAGAYGYGSVTMGDGSNPSVHYDFNFANSETHPCLEEDVTPTAGGRQADTPQGPDVVGPSRRSGSLGKRKQRDATDAMAYEAMEEVRDYFRSISQTGGGSENCRPSIVQLGKKNMNDHDSAHHREADNHGSENGQRNVPAMAAMSVFAYRTWRRSMRRDPVPMHNSSLTGQIRVHEILNGHPRIIQVLLAICSLKDEFIRPPDYTAVQPLIQEHGYKYRPWFDGCIGAIDGTHVPCVPPSENADGWINRKGFHSQNILAACSFDMKFMYMLTGDPLHEDYAEDCMPVSENVDMNADYEVDDVASGTEPSTGPQHHDTRRDAMNMLRDMMADDMWDRFQSAPWYRTT
ncbi:hypothetical protein TIFTF001_025414 [Ficus carica]|uniref:Uncharacterized protein n=1 Tax=Ficus carica TaxID=3494 RepID=A0AA88AYT1_FICCA|nr:hypothetical protein TIFTF001_025414 [Ficus carica]